MNRRKADNMERFHMSYEQDNDFSYRAQPRGSSTSKAPVTYHHDEGSELLSDGGLRNGDIVQVYVQIW